MSLSARLFRPAARPALSSPAARVLLQAVGLSVAFAASASSQDAPEVVWAPLFDQLTQSVMSKRTLDDVLLNHSEFQLPYERTDIERLILESLDAAHRRGIRIIDLYFFHDQAMFTNPALIDPWIQGLNEASDDWVEAVEQYNTTCGGCEAFRLRLRLVAQPGFLNYFRLTDEPAYTNPPNPAGLPANPAEYHALATGPNGEQLRASGIVDLGQPVVVAHVREWVHRAVDRVRELAPSAAIDLLSLGLDVGHESSLLADAGIVSFQGVGYYDPQASFDDKLAFYRSRQRVLKEAYRAFAAAARQRGVSAGIFFQTFPFDGKARGTFDLFELLDGTGISTLHHTLWPRVPGDPTRSTISELEQRMIVAFSATIARTLALDFDTEFSWPWYYPGGSFFNGPEVGQWIREGVYGGDWGSYHVGDFDGDGASDLMFVEGRNLSVALSLRGEDGPGFRASAHWLAVPEPPLPAAPDDCVRILSIFIGDFTGDRRDDLLFHCVGDSLHVSASLGNRFELPRLWVSSSPGFGGVWGRYLVGDFDADGRVDLLFWEPTDNSLHVATSNGSAFGGPGTGHWPEPGGSRPADAELQIGDFNGDGADDVLILERDHSVSVSLSGAGQFWAAGSGEWLGPGDVGGTWGRYRVGDFDADGDEDLMFVEPQSPALEDDVHVHVARSSGNDFLYAGIWLDPNYWGEDLDLFYAADFTGDGRDDIGYLAYLGSREARFFVVPVGNRESLYYNGYQRSDDNARSFRNQALAGLRFGASGIVYTNWTTGDITAPPATPAWQAIIGGDPASDDHLNGPGGLFDPQVSRELPPARYAIYVSTLGRAECEELQWHPVLGCHFSDYLQWFYDFGLDREIRSRQVDVLTDAMIRREPKKNPLLQYTRIYLPFETSQRIDPEVCAIVKQRNVRRQIGKHSRQTTTVLSCLAPG